MNTTINNILEISRWTSIAIGIFLAMLWGNDPVQQFSIITAFAVIFIAGLTGIESIFFSESASEQSGYKGGREYQRQSGANNIALAITAILVYLLGWGYYAQLTIMSVLIIFLALSGTNHAYSAIKESNHTIKNMSRPIITIVFLVMLLFFMLNSIYYPLT
ncbi:MAG: hypothetical protein PHY59_03450 [Methanobacterium sp.]|nr:hypothetical protein [Methanobacterium sp.]